MKTILYSSEFLLILTEYSSEFLLCEKRDILSKIPCLHTWLKDAGLIYKILRVSMKNYIDQGWMENLPLYAIEGYLRAEGIPVPEQGE